METQNIIGQQVQKMEQKIGQFSDFENLDQVEELAAFLTKYKEEDGFQSPLLAEAQEEFGKKLKKVCGDKFEKS